MFDGRNCGGRDELHQNFVGETDVNMDIDINMGGNMMANSNMGAMMPAANYMAPMMAQSPIVEPMREKIVHKTILHEVPHVCPLRTKVVNHHVYRHTYQPSYSCCEENTVSSVQCGSCCNYR